MYQEDLQNIIFAQISMYQSANLVHYSNIFDELVVQGRVSRRLNLSILKTRVCPTMFISEETHDKDMHS